MTVSSVEKSVDAFRTISEVATDLDLPQHVLRFWETRFSQIKPMKRGGGRRYYRPDDVELLKGIRHLLYGEGYTIKGVQRILREQGVRFVMDAWRDSVPAAQRIAQQEHDAHQEHPHAPIDIDLGSQVVGGSQEPVGFITPEPHYQEPAEPFAQEELPVSGSYEEYEEEPLPSGLLPDDVQGSGDAEQGGHGPFSFIDRFRGHEKPEEGQRSLSKDDVRRLQATLFELLECKRMLDQAR